MELDGPEGASAITEQWWKLGYVADDEQPAKAEVRSHTFLSPPTHPS